jgi:intracellular multiplication protein IcmE
MSDDNSNEDFEGGLDDLGDSGFDDFSAQGTLGDMWRNNPMVKIGVIFGVFALIVGGIILFGYSGDRGPPSRVPTGRDVNEPPASGEVSEVYREAVEETNIERVEEALRTNKSALPTPLEPPRGMVPLGEEDEPAEDPLERWRRLQEARKQQAIIPEQREPDQPSIDTRGATIDELSQLMLSQMQSVLDTVEPPEPQIKYITQIGWLVELEEKAEKQRQEEAKKAALERAETEEGEVEILIQEGTIYYGQLLIEANTDAPGPVLAQVVTGPYAGSRMLGSFESTENYLILTFDSIIIDDVGYETEAVALDPDSSLPGVVTEIDRRYFKRVILPMAGAFVEGMSEAISESGQTTITVSAAGTTTATEDSDKTKDQEVASGVAEAGEELRNLLNEEAERTEPMIRVEAGTPIGILFLDPVGCSIKGCN